jgi:two-component system sensor histidine kinase QseC
MTRSLAVRDAEDLTALDVSPDARELRPFALALNDLMSRLGAARRREAEFTAAAAHELRTPLAGLRVQAQIAASSSDPAVRSRALEQIQTSVDRTARLVTGLLALAREDDMPVIDEDRRWVTLRSLFGGAENDARVTFVEGDALLNVDPDRFGAAAANLLANAQAHAATSILISYDPTSGRLIVEDDGPGVAFSDLHRLGRRFFRAANAPSGGSGLGLSIVLATVKAHGGQVQFLRSPGGGLRVEVTIPEQASESLNNSTKRD